MTSKKQKREIMKAKREAFEREMHESGMKALKDERERRQHKELDEWRDNHVKNHSIDKMIKECPHCRIKMAREAREAKEARREARRKTSS